MTPAAEKQGREIEDAMQRVVAILPYPLMAVSLPLALATAPMVGSTRTEVWVLVGLSLATLVWVWWWTTAHPHWRTDEPRMAVYYAGRTAAAFALTWINPFFGFFAWIGYVDAIEYFPPRRAWIALTATASIVAGSQVGGLPPDGPEGWAVFGVLLALNLALVCGLSYYEVHRERDHRRRREMITELEHTNAQLEAALSENAGLQAQLVIQAREAGTHEERRRLAREIHDTIAQDLSGIVTQLEASVQSRTEEDAREHVRRAIELAREGLNDARRSVRDLNPGELEHAVLSDALKELADTWSRWWNVQTEVTVTGTVEPLHDEIEATLLRVAQEALANVSKHAHANRVGVTLSYMGDEVVLDIRDDGAGFDPDAASARHSTASSSSHATGPRDHGFGLAGMRQRVERIAGRLDVESAPGRGTAVSAQVPSVARDA